mgnify:CR=1 FL=1
MMVILENIINILLLSFVCLFCFGSIYLVNEKKARQRKKRAQSAPVSRS